MPRTAASGAGHAGAIIRAAARAEQDRSRCDSCAALRLPNRYNLRICMTLSVHTQMRAGVFDCSTW
jgi:hypothetical protein